MTISFLTGISELFFRKNYSKKVSQYTVLNKKNYRTQRDQFQKKTIYRFKSRIKKYIKRVSKAD